MRRQLLRGGWRQDLHEGAYDDDGEMLGETGDWRAWIAADGTLLDLADEEATHAE